MTGYMNFLSIAAMPALAFEEEHDGFDVSLFNFQVELCFSLVEQGVFHLGESLAKFRRAGKAVIESTDGNVEPSGRFGKRAVRLSKCSCDEDVPVNGPFRVFRNDVWLDVSPELERRCFLMNRWRSFNWLAWCHFRKITTEKSIVNVS